MHSLKSTHLAGMVVTFLVGTLLHFTWEWSGRSPFVAVFSAVNESTWEHLKLLFFPFFLFSIIEYGLYGKEMHCFFTAKACAVLLGMFTIVSVFYTYTGILGTNYLLLDIATFILGVVVSYLYSYRRLSDPSNTCFAHSETLAILILIALATSFALFTFNPPALGLFLPPVS